MYTRLHKKSHWEQHKKTQIKPVLAYFWAIFLLNQTKNQNLQVILAEKKIPTRLTIIIKLYTSH